MKPALWLGSICLAFASQGALAQDALITATPDQLVWQSGNPTSKAVLHGDAQFGVSTMRVRIPPHTDLPPHGAKQGYFLATVISGTLQVGLGASFDEAALVTLPAGSYFTHPAGKLHFARTGEEAVVLQVTKVEPSDKPVLGK